MKILLSLVIVSLLFLAVSFQPVQASAYYHVYRMQMNYPHFSFPSMHPTPLPAMNHIQARLYPVNGSNVSGIADLVQLQNKSGTHITVLGFGLQPNNQYVSLYYDNHICALEPYSVDDVIGGVYTANRGGVGVTQANQSDNLDEINSISIRQASDFHLLACANIHP